MILISKKFFSTLFLSAIASSFIAAAIQAAEERRIMHCPITDKDEITIDDCKPFSYGISIILTFVFPVIMALFTLFFIPFFFCGRYCCSCCGGSKQTEGVCCACGSTPAARYSWFEILRVKIYAILCAVFAIVSLSYGMSAAAGARSGLSELLDSLSGVGHVLVNEIDLIGKKLTVTTYDPSSDTFSTNNLFADTAEGRSLNSTIKGVADDVEKNVKDATRDAEGYIDTTMTVLFVIVLLPCISMGLNTVFAFFNVRSWGPMINCVFLLLFMFILWLAHGVVATAGFIISDVCAEIKGLADQERNVVTALVQCPTALLDEARTNFQKLEKTEAKAACEKMNATCVIPTDNQLTFVTNVGKGKIFECPNTFLDCENATFARLLNYSENGMKINGSVYSIPSASTSGYICRNTPSTDCTLAKCADTCTLSSGARSATGKAAAVAIVAFRAAATVATVFADLGAKFYVCDSLLSLVTSGMAKPCEDVSKGFFDGYMATGMQLMFCIFAVYVCSWGSKRFIPFSDAGKLQSGMDEKQQHEQRPVPTTGAVNTY